MGKKYYVYKKTQYKLAILTEKNIKNDKSCLYPR